MVELTKLNLSTRLELEAVACMLITQILNLMKETERKIDELMKLVG